MFNRRDFLNYFNQLERIEKRMELRGKELIKLVSNPQAKKLLESLVRDEIRHEKIVKDIRNIYTGHGTKSKPKISRG